MTTRGFDVYGGVPASGDAHLLYLKILDDFPALIWRAGLDSLCDWFNATWLEFTGRSMQQEQGNGWAEGVHPDDLDRCVGIYLDHFHRHQPFRMEYRLKHHSGEYRWILDIGRPFFDLDGSFLGYIGSCYDVSENHRLVTELTELGSFRDRLLGIVGHDLKNQVGCIPGLAQILAELLPADGDPEIRSIVADIRSTSDRTLELLYNLMRWASARSGLIDVQSRSASVSELFDGLITFFQVQSQLKGLVLSKDVDHHLQVRCDPEMLAAILRNLVGNAIKFTPRGGSVTMSARALESPESRERKVELSVRDTGIGMDGTTLAALNGEGTGIASKPGTANEKGSGLGLLLCREFLDLNGGSLRVESAMGQGSEFIVTLSAGN